MESLNVILHANVFETPDDLFNKLEAEIQYLSSKQTRVCIQGKMCTIPREIAAFGDPHLTYTFSGLTVDCQPWTPLLLEIKSVIEKLCGDTYNFVLVNRYKDGSSCIGQHKDAEKDLDPTYSIASLSLGATRKIVFKRPHYEDQSIDLEHNTLLLMKYPTNRDWTHGIPRQQDVKDVRINLTFRKIVSSRDKRKNPEGETTAIHKKTKQDNDCGIFTDDYVPDDVFSVGEDVFVTVSHFRGNVTVHVRRYKKYGKTFYPTKEGVTLQPWWIPYIMGRQDIPQTPRDLQGSVFLPDDQIKIESEDFETYTFTRITMSKQGETVLKTITITADQWRQMLVHYKSISTVVSNYVFRAINFMDIYKELFTVPVDESVPSSLDVSLGRQFALDVLQRVVCDTLKNNSGMKDPEIMDCEEVWGNRIETFNAAALSLDVNELVHYFNEALWEDQPFLCLKPSMYVTNTFLKMIRMDVILKQARHTLCPANVFEYFDDVL